VSACRGSIHGIRVETDDPDAVPRAERVLVVSEDLWNRTMSTSVIVPLYPLEEIETRTVFFVPVDDLYADCTLVQSLDDDDLGADIGRCRDAAMSAVEEGLRAYLDIDDLREQRIRRPPAVGRGDFWPRQRGVLWGTRHGDQRERYVAMPSDELNVRADHTAMLFMTSRDKAWRSRWQVPREGGFVISGDIDQFSYSELVGSRRPSPPNLSRSEMAEVATAVASVLELG
jgi:mRNA-degrading endonuclease toxin of MazEF toxin-antitoxin module